MFRYETVLILKEVLDREVTPYKLINIDLLKKDIYIPLNNLNLGTATKLALQNSQVSNELKTRFKQYCVIIIRKLIEKLQERNSLKYSIVRNSASLSPVEMVQNKEECPLKFKRLVEKLFDMKWISAVDADNSKLQHEEFLSEYKHCKKNSRLDKFLGLYIDRRKFDKLWNICKLTFTLSRGFSVNKEILVENLQQKSLISQKMVYDYMTVKHASSLYEYTIPNSLILKCESSHAK